MTEIIGVDIQYNFVHHIHENGRLRLQIRLHKLNVNYGTTSGGMEKNAVRNARNTSLAIDISLCMMYS